MTTFNAAAVADAVIAFEKPITLQQGRALRDNPKAAFEGAAGAYRMRQINTLSGAAAQTQTFTGLGEFEGLEFFGAFNASVDGSSTVRHFTLEYSTDGGSSWSSPVNWLTHVTANQIYTLSGAINFADGALRAIGSGTLTPIVRASATITGMSLDVDAVRFSCTHPSPTQGLLIRPKGATV